ncbi:DUF4198 domain-containing protein [Aquimarina sediminis]|uniref:DUF4198 domain-containing protein n=1 Tax=Aquimarina sediminis TaxID=2070536 RepID=UPI000CA050DB|nr:DUF4198 domain-containing protein [Aquimarina sediminis]
MKKITKIIIVLLLCSTKTFAHFFWIETNPEGTINKEHEIRVYFGEFASGESEKTDGEVFKNAQYFTLWVIDQEGNKTQLKTTAEDAYHVTSFTPKSNGTYSVVLDNKKYKVLDFTKYDYGIFRPQYHSVAKIEIGENTEHKTATVNPESITITDLSSTADKAKLQVLFKNQPLVETEVTVFMKENWSKKIKTDKNGVITFGLPFKTRYVVEATHEDKKPGVYNNEEYQFTWHCAVYTIN